MSEFTRLERFAFLEHMVIWYEGVTAKQVAEVFGVTRPNAQRLIKNYSEMHPENLIYDKSKKKKIASKDFSAHYLKESSELFMGHLKAGWYTKLYRESSDWEEINIEDADASTRIRLDDNVLKEIIKAITNKNVLKIKYQSIKRLSETIISPNHLVHADFRYHVRAFCHEDSKFKDYVIGRIKGTSIIEFHPETGQWMDWRSSSEDIDWNQFVDLKFKVNPDLDEDIKKALLLDYKVEEDGSIRIRCRSALEQYISYRYSMVDTRLGKSRWIKV